MPFFHRKKNLQDALGLPKDNARISELSGGQQKIVSLSVTFLQQPKLMILDEPTVGSDPTLGDYIWKYLHMLCSQENIIIIVVTHYIEEAGRAHITGIMRDGQMLEQGPPKLLIERYQQNTLEDVFLHLCMTNVKPLINENDNKNLMINMDQQSIINNQQVAKNVQQKSETFFSNVILNLWILVVLIHKNLSQFFQFNITLLVFLIPAFQALILGLLYDVDSVAVCLFFLIL